MSNATKQTVTHVGYHRERQEGEVAFTWWYVTYNGSPEFGGSRQLKSGPIDRFGDCSEDAILDELRRYWPAAQFVRQDDIDRA